MDSQETIKAWLKQILNIDNLEKYKIIINGNNDKSGGYMSRIFYIKIKPSIELLKLNLNLVVKIGTTVKEVEDTFKIGEFFLRENFIYEDVFPVFSKFEKDKHIEDTFDSYPKYYGHLFLEDVKIIALQDITKNGFRLTDRKNGMDLQHCKLVLKAYAKLHSLSMALKDQDKETYNYFASQVDDIFSSLIDAEHSRLYMESQRDEVLKCLKQHDDEELYEKYKNEFEDMVGLCKSLLLDKDEHLVFLHGDNWSNNFMFKYQDGEPVAVSIVDWQLSSLRSPVFDISRFLFSVCRQQEFRKLEDLLKYYYSCFAEHLIKLGSDPEKLFNFSNFKRHWIKYCSFGVIGSNMIMKLAVLDEEEAPSIAQLENGTDYNKTFNMALSGNDLYYQRVKDVISAYFEIKTNKNFLG